MGPKITLRKSTNTRNRSPRQNGKELKGLSPKKTGSNKKNNKGIKKEASSYKRCPYGDIIASVDGKKFYKSVMIHDEIISVNDSVDILRMNTKSKKLRESNLAKIAAIYVDRDGKLKSEVAFYFDSGEKIPHIEQSNGNKRKWKGFRHSNEVLAFNKFEEVEIETFDEKVYVHASLEEYIKEIHGGGDEEINVFCNSLVYRENYSIVKFNIHKDWEQIMVESSKYYKLYLPFLEKEEGERHRNNKKFKKSDSKKDTQREERWDSKNKNKPDTRKEETEESEPEEKPKYPEINLNLNSNTRILGRDEEAEAIRTFMETNIKQGGTGQILYISGVPGTGKTMTVKMVSKQLVNKKLKGNLPWFDLIEINAVHLSKPNELYRVFYNKLFGKKAPSGHSSYEELDKYFTDNKTPCVLVLDEADYIVTKTQKVLFTLFDLPCKKNSKFILVIISNTMDLNYKMKSSIQSRLGFGSLVFKPYRYQQIMQVIEDKLGKFSSIDPVALQLCARRVTNYSGDMRKALQICKLAIREANGRKITVADMSRISNMVLNSSVVDALEYVSTGMKCLLVSIILVLKEIQMPVAPAIQVYNTFRGMITVLKPELDNYLCKDSFKHLLISTVNNGIVTLEPTVFSSYTYSEKKKTKKIFSEINEDLGDVGVSFQVDIGHLFTALSKDPYWQSKLESVG